MKRSLLLAACLTTGLLQPAVHAATQINTATVSGVWTLSGSPYYINNSVTVPASAMLTIQPGVEVIFTGNYELQALGKISAIGTPESKIIFKASDTTGWSDNSTVAGGWLGLMVENGPAYSLSTPTFEHCIFTDIKKLQNNYAAFIVAAEKLYMNQCEFYHNKAVNTILMQFNNNLSSLTEVGQLKMTNCSIHDNNALNMLYMLYNDSCTLSNNTIYNNHNTGGMGLITFAAKNDMSENVLVFKENELYNNTLTTAGGVLNCLAGGNAYITHNTIHHNHTTQNAAVKIQSKTALIERNTIVNNSQVLGPNMVCGITDGGGALQLLGQILTADVPGKNEHIVRNNVIANNHSSIGGGGIWIQHAKANIVNNTIINNTADVSATAIHALGDYCLLKVYNNIISGNRNMVAPTDTTVNFSIGSATHVSFSQNIIDYNAIPSNPYISGAQTNIYDHQLWLQAPTQGAGTAYNALSANFSLTGNALNCINQGNNNAPDHGSEDYYGHTRIYDHTIDLGAIEYQTSLPTGLNTPGLSSLLNIYPNPGSGMFTLNSSEPLDILAIQLYDLSGRAITIPELQRPRSGMMRFDLSGLPEGGYILHIQTEQGVSVQKLLLQYR